MRTTYKILPTLKDLLEVINYHRSVNDTFKIVFTNGCFDIFHAGHVQCLEHAKSRGDLLIVAVNSDESVKRVKGEKRPIIPEEQRLRVVAGLECVDYVIKFDEDTPYALIMMIKPDVLIKGGDWDSKNIVGSDIVKSHGGEIVLVDYEVATSSTQIIGNIVNRYRSSNEL